MLSFVRWPWLCLGMACSLTTVVFQNCSEGFRVAELSSLRGSSSFTGPTGESLLDVLSLSKDFESLDPSLVSGSFDANCMSSSTDACIFWKNPSATNLMLNGKYLDETPEGETYPLSTLAPLQQFGVNVGSRLTAGQLRNSSFDVHYRTGATTKNYYTGNLKVGLVESSDSALAGQRFGLEQIQTFFTLDTFREFMVVNAGGFYAQGRGVGVNAVNLGVELNAYYSPNAGTTPGGSIDLGIRKGTASKIYPLALNSEVTVHEVSHANLDAANISLREAEFEAILAIPCSKSGKAFYVADLNTALADADNFDQKVFTACGEVDYEAVDLVHYCKTSAGCLSAIDEGQADFFAMAYFLRAPSVGELGMEEDYVRFWRRRSKLNRTNVDAAMGISYNDDFLKTRKSVSGEIHDMGEIISEILFDVLQAKGTDRDAFLKTVSESLSRLSGSSTFLTMKDQLISIDQSSFGAKNASQIRKAFGDRGY